MAIFTDINSSSGDGKTSTMLPDASSGKIDLNTQFSKDVHGQKTKAMALIPMIMNKPTRIEHGRIRCLILDAPSNENLPAYIEEMRDFGVTDLVRTCDLSYDEAALKAAGIHIHEMVFGDGEPPSDDIIRDWIQLIDDVSARKGAVGVHCVAGLGRAPVLVAVALVEKGMNPLDAITYIRDRRKGAINRRQLQYLCDYKRRSKTDRCGCSIM